MSKFNRIAVLLAGDFRCWPRAAEYIFEFIERQADLTDYYFATWTYTQDFWCTQNTAAQQRPVTEIDITWKFRKHNKNLINFQIVNQIAQPDTFYYQAYLAKLANIMKRRHELDNKFVYDQVIEMRPDLYFNKETNCSMTLTNFEYLNEAMYYDSTSGQQLTWPVLTDTYYQTNSFSNDIFAERCYHKKFSYNQLNTNGPNSSLRFGFGNHFILYDYVYARRLHSILTTHGVYPTVIRPNFPWDNLHNYNLEDLRKLSDNYRTQLTS